VTQTHWYRLVHGDNTIDWLSTAAVERILTDAGVNMADPIDAASEPRPVDNGQHGAA
jgi:bifunctional non-homologous end joining protein LigD